MLSEELALKNEYCYNIFCQGTAKTISLDLTYLIATCFHDERCNGFSFNEERVDFESYVQILEENTSYESWFGLLFT